MTARAEAGALGSDWREAAASAQESALPSGRVVVSCSARLGSGGLGRHLCEIVDALRRGGRRAHVISGSTRRSSPNAAISHQRHMFGIPYLSGVLSAAPVPVSAALRTRAFMSEFDAYAARRLPEVEHLIAFNGQATTQFRAARRAGYESIELVSANSHIRRVARQHALAHRAYPLERSWTTHLVKRNLGEYARADRIYVSSRYVRESFLEEGFSEELLSDFPLTPDPRYERVREPPASARFDIVYIGSLAVHKGVPLLVEAFRRLPYGDMRLLLVGGWRTRGMRRFIEGECARDRRISICPGDPLPQLRGARLCVHPTFEDGFAYAPAEALACGVPVIVSEDTGMKDLVDAPRTGLVLPTGDVDALSEAIEAAYRGEIFTGDATRASS
jgi:glycosyltransferase involved in cell wall biosynthesis